MDLRVGVLHTNSHRIADKSSFPPADRCSPRPTAPAAERTSRRCLWTGPLRQVTKLCRIMKCGFESTAPPVPRHNVIRRAFGNVSYGAAGMFTDEGFPS